MTIQAVLLPLFVQVLPTFALMSWAAVLRVQAIRSRTVAPRNVALREPNWPPRVLQVMYAFQNQIELPLLFYVLTILAWVTRQADLLFVAMAWIFVVLRVLHAAVHVTDNDFRRRGLLFIAGAIVLAAMWSIYMLRILLS
jgi:hypothetical protein